jgi:hypothetical protein
VSTRTTSIFISRLPLDTLIPVPCNPGPGLSVIIVVKVTPLEQQQYQNQQHQVLMVVRSHSTRPPLRLSLLLLKVLNLVESAEIIHDCTIINGFAVRMNLNALKNALKNIEGAEIYPNDVATSGAH